MRHVKYIIETQHFDLIGSKPIYKVILTLDGIFERVVNRFSDLTDATTFCNTLNELEDSFTEGIAMQK